MEFLTCFLFVFCFICFYCLYIFFIFLFYFFGRERRENFIIYYHHNIIEILLKVALSTIPPPTQNFINDASMHGKLYGGCIIEEVNFTITQPHQQYIYVYILSVLINYMTKGILCEFIVL